MDTLCRKRCTCEFHQTMHHCIVWCGVEIALIGLLRLMLILTP